MMSDGISRLRETRISCELGPVRKEQSSCVFSSDVLLTVAMTVVLTLASYVDTRPFSMPMEELD